MPEIELKVRSWVATSKFRLRWTIINSSECRCDISKGFTMRKSSLKVMLAVAALIMLCFAVEQGDARCPMAEFMASSIGPRRTLKQAAAPPPPVSDTQYVNPPLQFGFYDQTCPSLNQIVADKVGMYSALDTLTPAKVLRLFFHDCFAQGCDASILLNSTAANLAEKDQIKSVFLDKYGVIDDIKAAAEAACPGIVSCADILALAAVAAVNQVSTINFFFIHEFFFNFCEEYLLSSHYLLAHEIEWAPSGLGWCNTYY